MPYLLEEDCVWAEGQGVNITVEFLIVSLKTASDILSSAVFYSIQLSNLGIALMAVLPPLPPVQAFRPRRIISQVLSPQLAVVGARSGTAHQSFLAL